MPQMQRETTVTYHQQPSTYGGGTPPNSYTVDIANTWIRPALSGRGYLVTIGLLSFIAYIFPDDVAKQMADNFKVSGVSIGVLGDPRIILSYLVLIYFLLLLQVFTTNLIGAKFSRTRLGLTIDPLGLATTGLKPGSAIDVEWEKGESKIVQDMRFVTDVKTGIGVLLAIIFLLSLALKSLLEITTILLVLYFSVWVSIVRVAPQISFRSIWQIPPEPLSIFTLLLVGLIAARCITVLILLIPTERM